VNAIMQPVPLPLPVWRSRAVLLLLLIAFGVLMVYIALLMKDRFGAGPLEIGVVVAFSSIAGRSSGRMNGRYCCVRVCTLRK